MDSALKKISTHSLGEHIQYPIDVFIACGSYEDRCKSIVNNIKTEKIAKAIIVENENLSEFVGSNSEYLSQKFSDKLLAVKTSSTDSVMTADNLQKAIRQVIEEGSKSFFIDITTFRHESLLILLSILRVHRGSIDKITLGYSTAEDYSIGDDNENKWLSKGVANVRTILGFSGDITPSKKMHLIVLVGYEHQRAAKLIEILEPSILTLGHGAVESATEAKHKASQELFYDLLAKLMTAYGDVEKFDFFCNDPLKTKSAILTQAAKYSEYNTVLAPMNTKLSTVGAALAAFERPELQICYAEAAHYNYRNYSSPGSNCYLIDLPT